MRVFIFVFAVAAVTAVPKDPQGIVGGLATTVSHYPFHAALLHSSDSSTFWQACSGSIITSNAILSAAHCFYGDSPRQWRLRVGSSWANSGGWVHEVRVIVSHQSHNTWTLEHDLAVIRTTTALHWIPNAVAPAAVAGENYKIADSEIVSVVGWGTTSFGGSRSEQLRHVQILTINQDVCKNLYAELGYTVTANMMCSSWMDLDRRGQCQGDSGSPVVHNNVVVGVSSWDHQCALARYPGVNVRLSNYSAWIQAATS